MFRFTHYTIVTDYLIKTHYYKYFHPKECLISDSSINQNLRRADRVSKGDMAFIYPFGCTMSVVKPSVVAFTSGTTTFPVDRPLSALYYNQNIGKHYILKECKLILWSFDCKGINFRRTTAGCGLRTHVF